MTRRSRPGWWPTLRRWLFGSRPWRPASPLGVKAEEQAARHLRSLGCTVLDRNVRTRVGEADLVIRDEQGVIAVVEVKSRVIDENCPQPPPEAAVTFEKRRRLVRLLRHLARANRWTGPVRIDVVAIDWADAEGTRVVAIRHHVDAVRTG